MIPTLSCLYETATQIDTSVMFCSRLQLHLLCDIKAILKENFLDCRFKDIERKEKGKMSGAQLGVIGSLALSVASSVAIVICNKALISFLGFPFGTFVNSRHHFRSYFIFLFTYFSLDGLGILNLLYVLLLTLTLEFATVRLCDG